MLMITLVCAVFVLALVFPLVGRIVLLLLFIRLVQYCREYDTMLKHWVYTGKMSKSTKPVSTTTLDEQEEAIGG